MHSSHGKTHTLKANKNCLKVTTTHRSQKSRQKSCRILTTTKTPFHCFEDTNNKSPLQKTYSVLSTMCSSTFTTLTLSFQSFKIVFPSFHLIFSSPNASFYEYTPNILIGKRCNNHFLKKYIFSNLDAGINALRSTKTRFSRCESPRKRSPNF